MTVLPAIRGRRSARDGGARCAVCGKGPQTGFTVSHSHRRTKRSFRPNLQSVRTTIDGENTRLRVCGKCLKAGKVQRVAA